MEWPLFSYIKKTKAKASVILKRTKLERERAIGNSDLVKIIKENTAVGCPDLVEELKTWRNW